MRKTTAPAFRILLSFLLLLVAGCGEGSPNTTGTDQSADADVPQAPALETVELNLQLTVGDRIPLRKVVEQEIDRSFAATGRQPDSSRSRLEMLLALTVEDVNARGARCAVRYDRIQYSRSRGGQQLDYDSARPPVAIPLELAAYQGMVGRGFTFWIGPDHQIERTEGFANFVNAALANIPPENRSEALLGVEAGAGEDGVVDFLNDTIGLFPGGVPKATGDTWHHKRRIARPVPMHIDTLCTLRELTGELAVIDLRGDVTPLVSTGVQTVAHEPTHMVVEHGNTVGECILFRDTGLPKESRLVQEFDLAFTFVGKPPFKEHRRVTTTIECYPLVRAAR